MSDFKSIIHYISSINENKSLLMDYIKLLINSNKTDILVYIITIFQVNIFEIIHLLDNINIHLLNHIFQVHFKSQLNKVNSLLILKQVYFNNLQNKRIKRVVSCNKFGAVLIDGRNECVVCGLGVQSLEFVWDCGIKHVKCPI